MKVAELEERELDAWVAKALGYKAYKERRGKAGNEVEACVLQLPGEREPWKRWRNPENEQDRFKEVSLFKAQELGYFGASVPCFSTDWSEGGLIIEREFIDSLYHRDVKVWQCSMFDRRNIQAFGKTQLIAAMRCFVASRFGEEVDDSQADHVQVR